MAPVNIRKHDRLHGAKPSLHISPPFLPQNTKNGFTMFGLRALGRLTADVHHKLCSKQPCTKRARPHSDCRKKQLTVIRKLDCFRSRTSCRPNAFSPAILKSHRFSNLFAPSRKVIFLDTSLGPKSPSENRSRRRGPPQCPSTSSHSVVILIRQASLQNRKENRMLFPTIERSLVHLLECPVKQVFDGSMASSCEEQLF